MDIADLSFIQVSMFEPNEPVCCSTGAATAAVPVTSITLRELRRKGLGHLSVADMNGDGVLDVDDLDAFFEQSPPFIPNKPIERPPFRRGRNGRLEEAPFQHHNPALDAALERPE